ncbi:Protein argonaute, Mid domain [Phytophthora cactorum]|nr:Protein argonaute, Mid domain [Phytophthora cactorum]
MCASGGRITANEVDRQVVYLMGMEIIASDVTCVIVIEAVVEPEIISATTMTTATTVGNAIAMTHLKGGRVLYDGHHQAIRLGRGTLVLNLDRARAEFCAEGPLLDVVGNAFGTRHYDSIRVNDLRDLVTIKGAVRQLVVLVTHRITNLKEIVGVSDTSACSTMINVNESSMSVEQYFRKRYQVRLRYPQLPPVNLGGRRPGTESWVPIELCEVAPGQPYNGTDRSNTDTIRSQIVVRPQVRLKSIQPLRERFNTENDPSLKAFGLSVGERMETVAARVLQAPDIQYANSILCPKNGSWNLANKTFMKPSTLSNWGVVVCGGADGHPCVSRRAVDHFVSNLCKEAVNRGINVVNRKPVMVTSADRPRGSLESWLTCCHGLLERDLSLGYPQLIFVIKANDDAMEYQEIKRTTHAVLGIPSQCVTAQVLGRARVQVLANLCLKINAKLGGWNAIFPKGTLPLVHEEPTILIGADVCYPKMEKNGRQSISSAAAPLDRHSSTYAARLAVPSGHNDFSHLPQLLWELFIEHYKHTRRQPKHVVYYRSGVSSSRVGDVVQAEMRSLRKAFRMLATNYEPHVTFIVANSHHHVRLFVSERASRSEKDSSGNPLPGTIVDTGPLADPQRLDFFLWGILAFKYTVMVDESHLSADQVEQLTYRLCYSYARCTRDADRLLFVFLEHGSSYTLAGLSDKLAGVMYFV